jgi:hypothetical protein
MAQDPGLAFQQNLINRYLQLKGLQLQLEFQRRQEDRYERQLTEGTRRFNVGQVGIQTRFEAGQELTRKGFAATQGRFDTAQTYRETTQAENLAFRGEQAVESKRRFGITEARQQASAKSLTAFRTRPRTGTREYYTEQGYSENTAQLAADRYNRLAPPAMTPAALITAGKTMMNEAITLEGQEAGQALMNQGMKAAEDQLKQTDTAFPATADSERVEVQDERGRKFTIPKEQLDTALAQGYTLVE